MKKLFYFLALTGTALFTSCSSDDDSNNNNTNNNGGNNPATPGAQVTAITLSAAPETLVLGQGTFVFTVKSQDGSNITTTSGIKVNDQAINGSTWTPTQAGTYTVKATYENLTSNTVSLTVTEPVVEPEPLTNAFTIGTDPTEHETNTSALIYLGTDENNLNYWVAAAFEFNESQEVVNEADIYFATQQVDPELLDFPTAGNYALAEQAPATFDAYVVYNTDNIVEIAGSTAVNLNINSVTFQQTETDPVSTWNYNYSITLGDQSEIVGNYSGELLIINGSEGGKMATPNSKHVRKTTFAKIQQAIAKRKAKK